MKNNNCKKCKGKCSCEDMPLTTQPPCGEGVECQDTNPCSEMFKASCIFWTEKDLICKDKEENIIIEIKTGDNISEIITKLFNLICDNYNGNLTIPLK
jgi:hypothetical protein